MDLHAILSHRITAGVVTGVVTAAAVDLHAFKKFQSWHEFATYSWSMAAFRWFQGAVVGGLTAAGLGGLLG